MNGAESLVKTLLGNGVEVCFANPGTSEMHFVAALDRVGDMRCVLVLFEGVAAGAADGYARMSGRPAATLLHLGPGLGNALSALHNAKKARSPVLNIIGDHATHHLQFNAPLTSDIAGMAGTVSHWVRTAAAADSVAADAACAIAEAGRKPGRVASLILPADCAWGEAGSPFPESTPPSSTPPPSTFAPAPSSQVDAAAKILRRGGRTLLLLGGGALSQKPLANAARIAAATGADVLTEVFNSRMERGAGIFSPERIPYPVDQALAALAPYRRIILAGATPPVAFFAYPGKPGVLSPPGCGIHHLATPEQDCAQALEDLAAALGAAAVKVNAAAPAPPAAANGALTRDNIGACIARCIPDRAIVVDESQTTGFNFLSQTRAARPHDWLRNRGGSIGAGLPLATGAAIACPGRKVLALESDGSGMYTPQSLWTQARENLDVTTVIFANHEYALLRAELGNVGAPNPGRRAVDMLSLERPRIDWPALARGMGVDGCAVEDVKSLHRALAHGLSTDGPYLIEAVM